MSNFILVDFEIPQYIAMLQVSDLVHAEGQQILSSAQIDSFDDYMAEIGRTFSPGELTIKIEETSSESYSRCEALVALLTVLIDSDDIEDVNTKAQLEIFRTNVQEVIPTYKEN